MDASLLHEGFMVVVALLTTLFIGIGIGFDTGTNGSSAFGSIIALSIPLTFSLLAVFYNYSVRDEAIQFLIKDKNERQIQELNVSGDIKKIIVHDYLELKKNKLNNKTEGE